MIEELASNLSAQHLVGSLKSIEPISGGEVNKVFIIKSDTRAAVLRVNGLVELERFQKETWCIAQSAAVGVLGARVYEVNKTKDYAYMLIGYIEGSNGNKIVATPKLWEHLGEYLKLIHEIPVKGFGEKLDDIISGSKTQWAEYLRYNIESLGDDDKLISMGVLDSSISAKLSTIFLGLASSDFTFGLNHGDYSLANIIVDEKSLPHVIDWGSAQAHIVPHHDLSVILAESLKEGSEEFIALLNGYGLSKSEFEAIKPQIMNLQLLEAVDKLRWALDKAPEWVKAHKTRLVKHLRTV